MHVQKDKVIKFKNDYSEGTAPPQQDRLGLLIHDLTQGWETFFGGNDHIDNGHSPRRPQTIVSNIFYNYFSYW